MAVSVALGLDLGRPVFRSCFFRFGRYPGLQFAAARQSHPEIQPKKGVSQVAEDSDACFALTAGQEGKLNTHASQVHVLLLNAGEYRSRIRLRRDYALAQEKKAVCARALQFHFKKGLNLSLWLTLFGLVASSFVIFGLAARAGPRTPKVGLGTIKKILIARFPRRKGATPKPPKHADFTRLNGFMPTKHRKAIITLGYSPGPGVSSSGWAGAGCWKGCGPSGRH